MIRVRMGNQAMRNLCQINIMGKCMRKGIRRKIDQQPIVNDCLGSGPQGASAYFSGSGAILTGAENGRYAF